MAIIIHGTEEMPRFSRHGCNISDRTLEILPEHSPSQVSLGRSDTSQPNRKCRSRAPLPGPLNVVFQNSSSQSCEPTLRGQGGEICPNKCD